MARPVLVDVAAERRQQARTPITFPAEMVPYIDWNAIAATRAQLMCDFHVTTQRDGSVRIEWAWAYDERGDRLYAEDGQ